MACQTFSIALQEFWQAASTLVRACCTCAWSGASASALSASSAASTVWSSIGHPAAHLSASTAQQLLSILVSLWRAIAGAAAWPCSPLLAVAPSYWCALALSLLALSIYSPPVWLARLAQRATGVIFDFVALADDDARRSGSSGTAQRLGGRRKFVALTIDDGPCPHTTQKVLEQLEKHGARATMFVIGSHVEEIDRIGAGSGKVDLGRQVLRNMVVQGHELGNHTW